MYRRVIVPLDGSEFAEAMLPHATEFGRRLDAEILLLRAVRSVYELASETGHLGRTDFVEEDQKAERREAEQYLAATREALQADGDVRVNVRIVEGPPVRAILDVVAEEPAGSLVMMSTHGRGGLSRLALGSVADQVVRELRGAPLVLFRPD